MLANRSIHIGSGAHSLYIDQGMSRNPPITHLFLFSYRLPSLLPTTGINQGHSQNFGKGGKEITIKGIGGCSQLPSGVSGGAMEAETK